MKRYRSKSETVDPERGDCLMLYADTVELISALDEKDRDNVIQAMFSWFLGAEEQSVIDGLVRTASKIATQILKSVIEKQKRNAGKFIEKCLKQQQRRLGHPIVSILRVDRQWRIWLFLCLRRAVCANGDRRGRQG